MAGKHRKPILPQSMQKRTPGLCRWCDKEILDHKGAVNARRLWHPECVAEYANATGSMGFRKRVFARDRGVCARCGLDTVALAKREHPNATYFDRGYSMGRYWQADHIVALINANGDKTAWSFANIQTLCTECHREKTKRDVAEAKRKRLEVVDVR